MTVIDQNARGNSADQRHKNEDVPIAANLCDKDAGNNTKPGCNQREWKEVDTRFGGGITWTEHQIMLGLVDGPLWDETRLWQLGTKWRDILHQPCTIFLPLVCVVREGRRGTYIRLIQTKKLDIEAPMMLRFFNNRKGRIAFVPRCQDQATNSPRSTPEVTKSYLQRQPYCIADDTVAANTDRDYCGAVPWI